MSLLPTLLESQVTNAQDIYVDGNRIGIGGSPKDRRDLSEDGVVLAARNGRLESQMIISDQTSFSRGSVYMRESKDLIR